jgi:ketosteroid isomerase-like protein
VSDANVELVRRVFDAFAERDMETLREITDPEIEFLPVTANLTTGGIPYRGHEGLERYLADVGEVWNELRAYPGEFRPVGDCVVALGRVHARGGGMVIDRASGWVWRMRNGKIAEGRVYASHEEALRAAGLGP